MFDKGRNETMSILKGLLAASMLTGAIGFAASAQAADNKEIQMLHWWTSGGEAAALNDKRIATML